MSGSRKTGAPKLRYKDCLKWNLKNAGIDVHTWEDKAQDRSCWHGIVLKSLIAIEERCLQRYNIVHNKRHSQLVTSDFIYMQQMPPSLSLQGWPNLAQPSLQGLNPLFFSFLMTLMYPNHSLLKTMDCR